MASEKHHLHSKEGQGNIWAEVHVADFPGALNPSVPTGLQSPKGWNTVFFFLFFGMASVVFAT